LDPDLFLLKVVALNNNRIFLPFLSFEWIPPQVLPNRKMGMCFWSTGINLIAMAAILTRRQKWTIKVLMALVLMACYHNSLRVQSYLLRAALVPASLLPWSKLYDEGDSSSFLHVTGLTREAFNSLLYVVIPPGHSMHWRRRGRPWLLPPDGMLGLLLCYLGSQKTIKWLCLIFGITPLPCSCILKKKSLYDSEAVALSSACNN